MILNRYHSFEWIQPKVQKRILQPRRAKNTFNTQTDKIREGERAKAELMEAFRIASATLNQVQQKLAVNKDVGRRLKDRVDKILISEFP